MPDEEDISLAHIVEAANEDVCGAFSDKIRRSLTNDEVSALSIIIGTEYFWARAEELLMFVQSKSKSEVTSAITTLAARFRNGELRKQEGPRETKARVIECNMCQGNGVCYCIRKGPGTAIGCPRCAGSGKCCHCKGRGTQ
jgi:hypothetical protein